MSAPAALRLQEIEKPVGQRSEQGGNCDHAQIFVMEQNDAVTLMSHVCGVTNSVSIITFY